LGNEKSVFIRVHPWLKMPKLIFAFFAVKPVRVADAVIGVPGA